jgi:DNA replication protein DnaD
MTTSKVSFAKKILENVSFDPKLFSKELKKVVATLLPYEIEVLTKWLISFVKEKPELHHSLYLIEIE